MSQTAIWVHGGFTTTNHLSDLNQSGLGFNKLGFTVGFDYGKIDNEEEHYMMRRVGIEYSHLSHNLGYSDHLLGTYKKSHFKFVGYEMIAGGRIIADYGSNLNTSLGIAADVGVGGNFLGGIVDMSVHLFGGPAWSKGGTQAMGGVQVMFSLGGFIPGFLFGL